MISIQEKIDLSNKTAVVTGGSKGIGLGIVRRLHEAGANIILADIDEAKGNQACDTLNSRRHNSAHFKLTDISQENDIESLIQTTTEIYGSIDIMVNNAGIFPFVPLSEMTQKQFDSVMSVNLTGVFLGCKYAAQAMKQQNRGGSIITITSIDALHPSAVGLAAYDASKHGVWGFLKNIALELAPHNIRVNAIAPGGINTPGVAEQTEDTSDPKKVEAQNQQFRATIPMGRLGEPDEIGAVALFLASDLSSYMTGSQLVVDGGALLT